MTLDGFCDHTAVTADDEIHRHYTELLRSADIGIWGRTTYQLMEYWKSVAENPTGNKVMDEFAATIDNIQKIVYSRTLESADWKDTEIKREIFKEEILGLKRQTGKNILAGSRSLILQLMKLNLIDEFQFCIHPVIAGGGLPLFKDIKDRIGLKLIKTKTFGCGAVIFYYEPMDQRT